MALSTKRIEKVIHASQRLSVGNRVMSSAESERIKDALALLKDAMTHWSGVSPVPAPKVFKQYGVICFAFPLSGHVIEPYVMSDGTMDFRVDGESLIPEEK